MKTLFSTTAIAAAVLLGACSSLPPEAPPELVKARQDVRSAESDPQVLSAAPMELKRATDTLNRANTLLAKNESLAEVTNAAYVASRQAQIAMEVARAKRAEDSIKSAEADRERARADVNAAQAARAQGQARSAQAQATAAQAQAAAAQANAADAQAQAAALQAQLEQIKAQQTERGMLVTLGDVLFEFNKADIKPTAQNEMGKLAEFLKKNPTRRVLVEGYTDNVGSADYNKNLSRQRAEAVRAALVAQGIAGDRIAIAGYGKDYPVATNNTDTNRALNRRVEVYISNNDQPVQPRRG